MSASWMLNYHSHEVCRKGSKYYSDRAAIENGTFRSRVRRSFFEPAYLTRHSYYLFVLIVFILPIVLTVHILNIIQYIYIN